ncbi:MAG: hypothetical protein COA96_04560 [SAR86 cluster bacterium]|uniref:Uncharacterized protein n=1 Tax=SAR86 cluster bacterium TaxID=2030880 RepID=A0A2A5B7C0_9GAMM|nr:MAG: hypothetical protein COA96_04560 [SAR86 cluster bacterium]
MLRKFEINGEILIPVPTTDTSYFPKPIFKQRGQRTFISGLRSLKNIYRVFDLTFREQEQLFSALLD